MNEETLSEAWHKRFGEDPPGDFPAELVRHRSIRSFSNREVSESAVRYLVGCGQSASTSSNLQLWSVVSVQDSERRQRIAELCADQKQVHTASWFLCFCADHARLRASAQAQGESCAGLDYTEFMLMAAIDASLAAERLVCAAELLGMGVCYIGALRNHPQEVNDFLKLPEGVVGLFGLCLGYPSEDGEEAIKPRLSPDDVWFREEYRLASTDEYDHRMAAFYESQSMSTSVTWTQRSGRRADGNHMTGREVWKAWLESHGMGRR